MANCEAQTGSLPIRDEQPYDPPAVSIQPGSRIGPSEVVARLGEGGMGAGDPDPVALRPTGEARRVLPDAQPLDPRGVRSRPIAVSPGGTPAYLVSALDPETQLPMSRA